MRLKYILKRILIAIPTFFGITILAYFILNLAPGSPLDALLADPGITPAELERKRVALGLDQPVIVQYFTWLKQLLTGNLGFSYSTQRPVATMILERLPATAILAASSILLSLVVSIPLGIFGIQAELKKRLFLRRTFHADDGNAQLLCWPGIYLPVCYCIPDSAIWRNVQFQRSTYLWRSDEAYDPAMPGAFLPADRRLGKTYAKQYA